MNLRVIMHGRGSRNGSGRPCLCRFATIGTSENLICNVSGAATVASDEVKVVVFRCFPSNRQ